MKYNHFLGWSSALFLSATVLGAQETNQLESVDRKLKQIQETFEKQQRETQARFEQIVHDQQAQIDALKKELEAAKQAQADTTNAPVATAATTNAPPPAITPEEISDLKDQVKELTTASKKSFISQFNPGIGFVGDTIFSYDTVGNDQTGNDRPGGADVFLRTAELDIEASVDPFARAYGVIAASADAVTGEANLDVEEAALITTSLPWNLTVQGGRFFADFGRLSYIHDHDLPFVYRPLVLDQYIGGESRTDGAQVNYLFPTKQFLGLTLGVGDQFGGDLGPNVVGSYRSMNELNYWGHLLTYFDLTPNLSLETGLSGLADDKAQGIGQFTGSPLEERQRFIGATDITLRYQPLGSTIHKGLVWGTEVLFNSAKFQDPTDNSFRHENSTGLYSYLESKISREYRIGFLFDWVEAVEDHHQQTFRYSPYVSWNPSEFQLLRLQYSHTDRDPASGFKDDDAVYLQWQFIIGRHVHGFKQR